VEVRVIELSTVFLFMIKIRALDRRAGTRRNNREPQLAAEMFKETSHCATQTV